MGASHFYYSENSGVTWTKSNRIYPFVRSVYMSNPNCIIASLNCILYSSNNGVTWNQATTGNISFLPVLTVYMVGTNAITGSVVGKGLWYSSDSGKTWTQTAINNISISSVYMVGTNAIAGSSNNKGIYYSSNSGLSWTQTTSAINNISINNLIMVGTNAIAGTTTSGIWYSSNSGTDWTQSNITINQYLVYMIGANAIATSNNQFIGTSSNGLWYSSVSGANWTQTSIKTGEYFIVMKGTNAIACGKTVSGILYSTNSGVSWSSAQLQTNLTSVRFLSVDMYGTNAIAGGNDNTGLWYSTNSGATWSQTNIDTLSFTSVSMLENNIIAASNEGIFYYSNIVCFKEGTKILTDDGYKLIEDLRPGHLVKTLNNGFKAIHTIGKRVMNHYYSETRIKDQLYKCSPKDFPEVFEDLIITGCHSILVDDFKSEEQRHKTISVNGKIYETDDKYRLPACIDDRTTVYDIDGTYTIYNLALENDNYYWNYGIYANGLLVETTSQRYLIELSNMELVKNENM